ncbi:hypothetical protein ACSLO8_24735, partial [Escherichia coli]
VDSAVTPYKMILTFTNCKAKLAQKLIGTFGNVCWALAGHLFQRLFRQYGRQLNIVLALLLVYCAVRIFY